MIKITKKEYKEKLMKDVRVKKEQKKSDNMVLVKDTNISHKMESKSCMSVEKNCIKWEKTSCYNYKKLFSFRNFVFFLGIRLDECARYQKLLLVEIRVNFIYFNLGFRKITRQTKWAVIPRYENFFILCLIKSYPGV